MGKARLSCTRSSATCASCKTNIGCSHFRNHMDTFWHLECFCCYVCDQPIHDLEFSMLGNYPYHKSSCHKELYHLKCDVCKQQFTSNNYTKHRFFNQKLCSSHWSDGTPYCSGCQRLKPRDDTRHFTLGDGRILCSECHDTAIMDNKECQRLYMDIQGFFAGLDLKAVGQQIPLLMVEREALNEAKELRNDELWHLPTIRGICLVERAHHDDDDDDDGERKVDQILMGRQNRLTYKCDVIAILILYGLPRLMMGSLLAHEMMHAWLAVNGYYPLSPEVEEGICQVVAHMWLDSQIIFTSAPTAASPPPDHDHPMIISSSYKTAETTTTTTTALMSASANNSSSSPPPCWSCCSSDDQYDDDDVVQSRRRRRRKGRRIIRSLTPGQFERRLGYLLKGHIEFHTSPVYGEGFRACHRAILEHGTLTHALHHVKSTGKFTPSLIN